MSDHAIELTQDDDGWDIAQCGCGWVSPPCPDPDIAAGFWGDHLTAAWVLTFTKVQEADRGE